MTRALPLVKTPAEFLSLVGKNVAFAADNLTTWALTKPALADVEVLLSLPDFAQSYNEKFLSAAWPELLKNAATDADTVALAKLMLEKNVLKTRNQYFSVLDTIKAARPKALDAYITATLAEAAEKLSLNATNHVNIAESYASKP